MKSNKPTTEFRRFVKQMEKPVTFNHVVIKGELDCLETETSREKIVANGGIDLMIIDQKHMVRLIGILN